MLTPVLMLALAAAQPSVAAPPEEEEVWVEDPFDIRPAASPETEEAQEPDLPSAAEAPQRPTGERLICRSRPELGSRTRWLRVCMTAAEWAHHATNMEQQRRDINDWGAQGGGRPQ